jgi:hypothetical protein
MLQLDLEQDNAFRTCLRRLVRALKAQPILVDEHTERVVQSDAAKQVKPMNCRDWSKKMHIGKPQWMSKARRNTYHIFHDY